MPELLEISEMASQAYLSALLPQDKKQRPDSPRIIGLVQKGLRNPRGITVAEIYELCRSISDFESRSQ